MITKTVLVTFEKEKPFRHNTPFTIRHYTLTIGCWAVVITRETVSENWSSRPYSRSFILVHQTTNL